MGAKTCFLVFADGDARSVLESQPSLDEAASERLATQLFPGATADGRGPGDLGSDCYTEGDEVLVGCYPRVAIVVAAEVAVDRPSMLDRRFLEAAGGGRVVLHAMHSVVDWFAFGLWEDGRLIRSLSLSPDSGVIEDVGEWCEFELPYWSGDHPVEVDPGDDPYPLPFHPLELGEAALESFFGFVLEGYLDDCTVEPEDIALVRFSTGPADAVEGTATSIFSRIFRRR